MNCRFSLLKYYMKSFMKSICIFLETIYNLFSTFFTLRYLLVKKRTDSPTNIQSCFTLYPVHSTHPPNPEVLFLPFVSLSLLGAPSHWKASRIDILQGPFWILSLQSLCSESMANRSWLIGCGVYHGQLSDIGCMPTLF